jgi:type IV pilus assembly protein PilW
MKSRSHGFSLIELMVAITLGLLVTGAVISVFVGSRSAYQSTSGVAALADSGRFALDAIEESARGAGYLACNHTTAAGHVNQQNYLGSPFSFDFRYGVGGFEANGTGALGSTFTLPATPTADLSAGDWTPNLDPAFTAAANQTVKGSDVLVLRSTLPNSVPTYTTADTVPGAATFTVGNGSALQPGGLAAISNCQASATFVIGAVPATSPAVVTLAGGSPAPGNSIAALPAGSAFPQGSQVTLVTTVVYYIGVGADGDSALHRLQFVNGAWQDNEIVPDVENMQILYGVDTTGTQTASAYMTADQVLAFGAGVDFNSVVSMKIAVLSASAPGSAPVPAAAVPVQLLNTRITPPLDTRLRRVFETTINLHAAVN